MFEPFSDQAVATTEVARREARISRRGVVTAAHLFLALMQVDYEIDCLQRFFGNNLVVARELLLDRKSDPIPAQFLIPFDSEVWVLFEAARKLAGSRGHCQVQNVHLLKALADCPLPVNSGVGLLQDLHLDLHVLQRRADILFKLLPAKEVAGELRFDGFPGEQSPAKPIAEPEVEPRTQKGVADFFTEDTQSIIDSARSFAEKALQQSVGVVHLLVALASSENQSATYASDILNFEGVGARLTIADHLNDVPDAASSSPSSPSIAAEIFTDDVIAVFQAAWGEAQKSSEAFINPELLLLGIMSWADSLKLLNENDLSWWANLKRSLVQRMHATRSASAAVDEQVARVVAAEENDCILVSPRVARLLRFAKDEAILARSPEVGASHLVLAVIQEAFVSEVTFVQSREFEWDRIRAMLHKRLEPVVIPDMPADRNRTGIPFAASIRDTLLRAKAESVLLRMTKIDLNHVALALFIVEDVLAYELVTASGESTKTVAERDYAVVSGLYTCKSSTSISALRKRLAQCSLMQHHADRDQSLGVYLRLSNLDEQIESVAVPPPENPALKSLTSRLSERSEVVFGVAGLEAQKLGQSHVSIESIMLGLIHESAGSTIDVFSFLGITFADAQEVFSSICISGAERTAAVRKLSHTSHLLLEKSWAIAQSWHRSEIEPEHILLAIADEHKGIAALACDSLQIDGNELRSELIALILEEKRTQMFSYRTHQTPHQKPKSPNRRALPPCDKYISGTGYSRV